MHKIHWTSIYSTGIKELDAQHQWMMELSNRVLSALAKKSTSEMLTNSIKSLIEFTKQHFHDEERLMKAGNYPGQTAHKQAHQEHLRQLGREILRINSDEEFCIDSVREFLKSWLITHILQDDKKVAEHILKKAPKTIATLQMSETDTSKEQESIQTH